MVRAIIFDMDGLMIDSESLYFQTEREIASRYGRVADDALLGSLMGRKPLESMTIFQRHLEIPLSPQELLELRDTIMMDRMTRELKALPGLHEILVRYRDSLRLAVATGNVTPFLDIALDTLQIRPYFSALQTSEEVLEGKPHPEIYERAIRRLELKPQECAVLEDSSNGALAAWRAGCYVIAVPSEYTEKQDFSFVHYRATDLFDAADHIEGLVV